MNHERRPSDPAISATVMASAGTGKTWQLVTRLTRLLFEGAKPDAILAITFTRKAAAEMQTRLAERLLQLASSDVASLSDTLRLLGIEPTAAAQQRARALYEALLHAPRPLRTTTFHAFCQEILRRFPLEADVPPGFELSEYSGELRDAALDALISEATAAPEGEVGCELSALLELCGSQHNLKAALHSFLAHRSDWWAYTANQANACAYATERLREQLAVAPDLDPLAALFTAETASEYIAFRDLLALHPTATNQKHVERFAEILDPNLALNRRHAALKEVYLTGKEEPRARKESKTQAERMGIDGEQRFLQIHRETCERLAAAHAILAAQRTLAMNTSWYRVGARLIEHFQRIKEEQRLLDFTDLEWRAYRLLATADNAHWVQYKLDQRIDHLLVDEFQDTNPTQWRLLLPLLEEMAAGESERRRSVFLVGDSKQSIYRFRRAEPELFHVARDWLGRRLAAQSSTLHTSYRSASAIMDCVNRLFGGEGPYRQILDDYPPHDTQHKTLWGRVELLPLIEQPAADESSASRAALRNPLREPRRLRLDDRYLREGRQMAARIRELIDNGTLLGQHDRARPMDYGDVMILVRKRTHVADYEQALREAGIPYLGAERGTLLDSLEVDDMVRLLETLIAPYNNLALAQVLRSPLFACSDADLIALASAERGHWFERLRHANAPAGTPLQRAAICLERWHSLAGSLPIHDLLDRIYSEGNVMARYEASYPAHLRPRVRANLTRFIELALEIDQGRYPSLTHFLSRLGELRSQDEAPDEAPASGNAQRVRLMTIHAAKGLEAPVVFLAGTAEGERDSDHSYQALVDWPARQAQPDSLLLLGKKEHHAAFTQQRLEQEDRAQNRETANLLYVALTRAKQLLFISGSQPSKDNSKLGWYEALQQALSDTDGVLESGQRPSQTQLGSSTAETVTTPPPAALRHPLPVRRLGHEIAPSRSTYSAMDGSGDEDGRLRGIAIHRMLERLTWAPTGADALAAVAAEFGRAHEDTELQQWWQEASAVHQAPAFRELFDASCYQQAWSEVPLQYRHEGRTVYGLIDRLVVKENEVVVVDYKTHRQAATLDLHALCAPYHGQLRYYVEGVRRLWPRHTVRPLVLFTAALQAVSPSLE